MIFIGVAVNVVFSLNTWVQAFSYTKQSHALETGAQKKEEKSKEP